MRAGGRRIGVRLVIGAVIAAGLTPAARRCAAATRDGVSGPNAPANPAPRETVAPE